MDFTYSTSQRLPSYRIGVPALLMFIRNNDTNGIKMRATATAAAGGYRLRRVRPVRRRSTSIRSTLVACLRARSSTHRRREVSKMAAHLRAQQTQTERANRRPSSE